MKRVARYTAVVTLAVGIVLICGCDVSYVPSTVRNRSQNTIKDRTAYYEGQEFRLSRSYSSWEEFTKDPDNYLPSETDRMQEAVKSVEFLAVADDRDAVMNQMFDKQFPGFGCGQPGTDAGQLDDVASFFVGIPRSQSNRYLGYVRRGNQFHRVCDFVAPELPMISRAVVIGNELRFVGMDGSVLHAFDLGESVGEEQMQPTE